MNKRIDLWGCFTFIFQIYNSIYSPVVKWTCSQVVTVSYWFTDSLPFCRVISSCVFNTCLKQICMVIIQISKRFKQVSCIHTYTHIYTPICTYTHIYTPIHTYTYLYTPIHTYTHIYTHIHTYTHIYTPLYTQWVELGSW